jgi:hypothetical protein
VSEKERERERAREGDLDFHAFSTLCTPNFVTRRVYKALSSRRAPVAMLAMELLKMDLVALRKQSRSRKKNRTLAE